MPDLAILTTPRLLLRPWRDEDLAAFAALNADPEVMRYFRAPLTRVESDARVQRIRDHFDRHGFGMWAVEVPGKAAFIGQVGLAWVPFTEYFTPCVEIGWRLARGYWGQGFATEGAAASLDLAFNRLGLAEVVAFTVPANLRSRRVMERLGMTHARGEEFDHPSIPEGHAMRRHVLYRIGRAGWHGRRGSDTGVSPVLEA
jgi:RimJ/RimL family protein N-acetyltransferase